MERKVLGKIQSAEFGKDFDLPSFIGLHVALSFKGGVLGCGDGLLYVSGIECGHVERENDIVQAFEFAHKVLKDAGVKYVSELVGVPVEVTLDDDMFKSFRVLTEVL